jgi:predicted patatin/cPLA2 family phospholipase
MQFVGSFEVLEAIQQKKWLQKIGGDHSHLKIALAILGGGVTGIFGGKGVEVMDTLGLGQVFEWVFGFSTGAPTGAYFLSGQLDVGPTIYFEECCSTDFYRRRRFWRPVNTGYLVNVIRDGPKQLAAKLVFEHTSKLIIGFTDNETGKLVFHAPTSVDIFDAIHASLAIPGVSSGPITIDGRAYSDGFFSDPVPVATIIEQYQPTHVLVVQNGPLESREQYDWLTFEVLYRHRISHPVRQNLKRAASLLNQQLRDIVAGVHQVPVGMAVAGGMVPPLTRDAGLVRRAADVYSQWWEDLLRGYV